MCNPPIGTHPAFPVCAVPPKRLFVKGYEWGNLSQQPFPSIPLRKCFLPGKWQKVHAAVLPDAYLLPLFPLLPPAIFRFLSGKHIVFLFYRYCVWFSGADGQPFSPVNSAEYIPCDCRKSVPILAEEPHRPALPAHLSSAVLFPKVLTFVPSVLHTRRFWCGCPPASLPANTGSMCRNIPFSSILPVLVWTASGWTCLHPEFPRFP